MMEEPRPNAKRWDLDIDEYINPWVPPSFVPKLPRFISRFLGYRATPQGDVGALLVAWWSFFGAFCGIATVSAVFKYSGVFSSVNAPFILGSFGASAILEYGVIGSPLGQPRNCILGHFVSALSGICIAKLFRYDHHFEEHKWIAGALAVGVSSGVMSLTNTSHPPGGATALLAVVDPVIEGMGWDLLPYVLIATLLLIGVALIINNIQRQFPIFWWTPKPTGCRLHLSPRPGKDMEKQKEIDVGRSAGSDAPLPSTASSTISSKTMPDRNPTVYDDQLLLFRIKKADTDRQANQQLHNEAGSSPRPPPPPPPSPIADDYQRYIDNQQAWLPD
ncbi:hypothetical protein H072_9283 [Dactylellina haptotyla CBS 200.50]|uniref:HPP transmembrane region domain-containing protein n=1 Tax=Dactylellina haptotyla (strain CBS 200.50) TaxID=1284197 RepID=S8A2Z6_DACHA|nr:hypothetical protein H072_9283 [Dactylellina haptotyla CBS 200.50]